MKDIVNSFKAHLYERTSSPLIGTFIFYWFICNYKLIMVMLDGDMKINEKFDLIKTLYPQNIYTPWEGFDIHYSTLLGNGLLMPLLITLIYIFFIPYPAKFIYKFWKNKQKEIQEIKQKIDDETPLTKEQSLKIKKEYYKLLIENNRQIEELKILKENSSEHKSNEISLTERTMYDANIDSDLDTKNFLITIEENNQINYGDLVQFFSNIKKEKIDNIVEKLEHYNLIKYDRYTNSIYITYKGRAYVNEIK